MIRLAKYGLQPVLFLSGFARRMPDSIGDIFFYVPNISTAVERNTFSRHSLSTSSPSLPLHGYFKQYPLEAFYATLVIAVAGCARTAKRLVAAGFECGCQLATASMLPTAKERCIKPKWNWLPLSPSTSGRVISPCRVSPSGKVSM